MRAFIDRLVYRTVALSTIPAFYALLVNTGVISPGGAA